MKLRSTMTIRLMWRMLAIGLVLGGSGCGPAKQPAGLRTVAAIEIPIRTTADKDDLVAILRRRASTDGGMHVDDVSDRWRQFEKSSNTFAPDKRGTVFIGVWRGADDNFPEAAADDNFHPGRTWLTFARGEDPNRSSIFRDGVMRDVHARWPDAKPIPIMPTGALPLADDMKMAPQGYRVSAEAAGRYGLSTPSPFVEQR